MARAGGGSGATFTRDGHHDPGHLARGLRGGWLQRDRRHRELSGVCDGDAEWDSTWRTWTSSTTDVSASGEGRWDPIALPRRGQWPACSASTSTCSMVRHTNWDRIRRTGTREGASKRLTSATQRPGLCSIREPSRIHRRRVWPLDHLGPRDRDLYAFGERINAVLSGLFFDGVTGGGTGAAWHP